MRSLLDITDNIVDGKIVHPKEVVRCRMKTIATL
ncbi:NAD-glutamate dehydrogenase [Paraglaciecola sp. Hal342]